MNGKNYGIIILAVLVIAVAGFAIIEIADMTRGEGSFSQNSPNVTVPTSTGTVSKECSSVSLEYGDLNASYRTITDMAGRNVTIPANVKRVLGSFIIYYVASDKIVSWDSNLTSDTRKFYPALPENIPVISSASKNYEAQIAMHPDLVFISCGDGNAIRYDSVNLTQEKYGTLPAVCLNNTQNVTNAEAVFRFLGDVLDRPERADELIRYYRGTLDEIQNKTSGIPKEKRTRVYYAEGANGLATDASGSIHSQLIDLCGGNNVATCEGLQSGSGMTAVTMESVLIWKPDVIITTSRDFTTMAYNDSNWQSIPAVQNHRIYVTPSKPGNWFDRSPSFYRIVGMSWTAHVLYPDLFPEDWLKQKVKEYFSVYHHYNLSDEELTDLLSPSSGSNI
ncbi:ABC transporter substrate-binding protein [Methanoregula sp. UBA64]|jgi:iron complex transport system substrate-binding protein|uniref:ABC transporter substrate-binding protein n=1 Tax=Methanoregula sp. UBA64 TaxID=1915554 RepID=UPI0025CF1219|nr:ABC transporter substrate-binding protein [Methanoregula sp. UBA64]